MVAKKASLSAFLGVAVAAGMYGSAYAATCSDLPALREQSASLHGECSSAGSSVASITGKLKKLQKKKHKNSSDQKKIKSYQKQLKAAKGRQGSSCGAAQGTDGTIASLEASCNPYADWPVTADEIAGTVEASALKEQLAFKYVVERNYWSGEAVRQWQQFFLTDTCWPYLLDENGISGFHVERFMTRDLEQFAVANGLGDAEAIESRNNNDREANRADSEALIRAGSRGVRFRIWAQELSCGAGDPNTFNGNWDILIRMSSTVPSLISQYTDYGYKFNSGAAYVTFVMTPRVADISSRLDPDGYNIYIFAPNADIPEWDTKIRNELLKYMHQ